MDDSLNIAVEEGDTEDFCITVDTPQFVLTREITINVTVIEGNAESKWILIYALLYFIIRT